MKKKPPLEISPAKSVLEELQFLRKSFLEANQSYACRVEAEIMQIHEAVEAEARGKKLSKKKLADLRDMLTLMRNLQVKPEKGRRRDLKKIDLMVGELLMLKEDW